MPTLQPQYSLQVSVNPIPGGQVCVGVNGSHAGCGAIFSGMAFPVGTSLIFTETPSPGYQFVSWSGDVSGTSQSVTVIVTSNIQVVANFAPIQQYTVTTTANPPSGGTISPSNPTVAYGTSLTFTETPAPGYQFVSWWADVSGTNPSVTVTVTSNMQIGASFEAIPFNEKQLTIGANMGAGVPANMTKGEVLEGSLSVTGGNDMRFYICEGYPCITIVLDENPVQSTYTFSITAQSDGVYYMNLDNGNGTSTVQVDLRYRVY